MKIPAIRKLVDDYELASLKEAEEDLMEENPLKIVVEGKDDGERLTHIIAAIWIMDEIKHKGIDFKDALREYTKKVRESIS